MSNESNSKFINWFWDLSSDDNLRRSYAGTMIIKFIQEKEQEKEFEVKNEVKNEVKSLKGLSSNGVYTLERLIRGISSSRDSSRQGFSACLCQFLSTFSYLDIESVITLIDESTKVLLSLL